MGIFDVLLSSSEKVKCSWCRYFDAKKRTCLKGQVEEYYYNEPNEPRECKYYKKSIW